MLQVKWMNIELYLLIADDQVHVMQKKISYDANVHSLNFLFYTKWLDMVQKYFNSITKSTFVNTCIR